MGQKFFEDTIGTVIHSSGVLTLSESRITLGGQQEYFNSLSYTISGLVASTKYNLFLVNSGSALSLVPSTNSISVGPTGYTLFKYIRSFVTNSLSAFGSFSGLISDPNPVGTIVQSMLSLSQFQSLYGTGWVLADGSSVSGSMYHAVTNNATVPDARGLFLRAAGTRGTQIGGVTYTGGNAGDANGDTMQGHKHNVNDPGHTHAAPGAQSSASTGGFLRGSVPEFVNASTDARTTGISVQNPSTDGSSGNPRTGAETRPANLAVNVFIKINME